MTALAPDPALPTSDNKRTAAHCATPFLPETGSWIHTQITGLRRYRPVVLTQEARNLNQFPVPTLYTAELYGSVKKMANRLTRRLTGEYPFYSRILTREGAGLIHAHFGYQGCRCLRAKREARLPMVTTFYGADAGSFPGDPSWKRHYERLFAVGELFLVEGSNMATRLLELGCRPDRLAIHHLGVQLDRIPFRERAPTDAVRILICAEFREKKGIPHGLLALGRALDGLEIDCRVRVIGDGPQRPQVSDAIRESGLEERVELLGRQPYARVLEELRESHLLLQPSMTAADGDTEGGAPVVLLEAQASGLPVVSTMHADIPEYVAGGREGGCLAPEGDLPRLAEVIGDVLSKPERWAELGRGGRRHVEENYNASVQNEKLESIYDTLM